jgi:membrane-bound lytic murein transglycosylase B
LADLIHMPRFKLLLSIASLLIATNPLIVSATGLNDSIKKAKAPHAKPASKTEKARQAGKASKAAQAVGPAYATRDDVMRAVTDMAQRRNLDADWVRQAVGQANYMPQVVKFIQPPPVGTPKNWRVYRSRFIDPVRIKAGVAFWQANREALERAERTTGVPAAIIAGVIGVETIYGQQMGGFRVLDALTTLAFDFPVSHPRATARSEVFKAELEQYLSLTHRTGVDPLSVRGSFAGAMGMPQFMPSSWVKYAIDFDGDGRIDLFDSPADVIGSVANYFVAFNWQSGMPTHYPVSFDVRTLNMEALMAPDILPTFSVPSFVAKGAVLEGTALQHKGPLALVELQNGDAAPSYVAGTENFYAITRYNWSSYYAMAVIELGQEVARAQAQANTTPSNTACNASSQAATSSSLTCK